MFDDKDSLFDAKPGKTPGRTKIFGSTDPMEEGFPGDEIEEGDPEDAETVLSVLEQVAAGTLDPSEAETKIRDLIAAEDSEPAEAV